MWALQQNHLEWFWVLTSRHTEWILGDFYLKKKSKKTFNLKDSWASLRTTVLYSQSWLFEFLKYGDSVNFCCIIIGNHKILVAYNSIYAWFCSKCLVLGPRLEGRVAFIWQNLFSWQWHTCKRAGSTPPAHFKTLFLYHPTDQSKSYGQAEIQGVVRFALNQAMQYMDV